MFENLFSLAEQIPDAPPIVVVVLCWIAFMFGDSATNRTKIWLSIAMGTAIIILEQAA